MKKAKVSQFLLVVLSLILITFSASSLVMANDVKNEIDNYLSYYTKAGSFSGAVLVARDNEILFSNGYGFADYELDVYNKINNIFRIGSLTKSFTAVSIMQLQEKNLLCVTDPLNKYIKNFPNGEQISIHNLLNHTSGIVNFTSLPKYQKNYLTPTPIKETINLLKEKKLNFDPGTKFEYSNSNYIILGYIIEKVTGQSYEDYLKENIFKPLDMNDSGFAYHHKIIENRSKGYQFDRDGEKKKIRSDSAITAHAAGALYSTVDDLYKWEQSFDENKLLNEKSIRDIFKSYKGDFGYGWKFDELFGRKRIYHNGRSLGYVSSISRYPTDNVTIIVLSNLVNTPIDRIIGDLAAIVFNERYELPNLNNKISAINIERFPGKYKINDRFKIIIAKHNNKLTYQYGYQPPLEIIPHNKNTFLVKLLGDKLTFIEGSDGNITKLVLEKPNNKILARKTNK